MDLNYAGNQASSKGQPVKPVIADHSSHLSQLDESASKLLSRVTQFSMRLNGSRPEPANTESQLTPVANGMLQEIADKATGIESILKRCHAEMDTLESIA